MTNEFVWEAHSMHTSHKVLYIYIYSLHSAIHQENTCYSLFHKLYMYFSVMLHIYGIHMVMMMMTMISMTTMMAVQRREGLHDCMASLSDMCVSTCMLHVYIHTFIHSDIHKHTQNVAIYTRRCAQWQFCTSVSGISYQA